MEKEKHWSYKIEDFSLTKNMLRDNGKILPLFKQKHFSFKF